jgi:hypothetical protein
MGFADHTYTRFPHNLRSGLIGLGQYSNVFNDKNEMSIWPFDKTIISQIFSAIPSYGRKFALGLKPADGAKVFISFGGVPKPNLTSDVYRFEENFTKVTLEYTNPKYHAHYAVRPSQIVYSTISGNVTFLNTTGYVLDSGASGLVFPNEIVENLNQQINPLPRKIKGKWLVNCNATVSDSFRLEVFFGEMKWSLPKEMAILRHADSNPKGLCSATLQTLNTDTNILGSPFLGDFVVLFDLDAMRLYFHLRLPMG